MSANFNLFAAEVAGSNPAPAILLTPLRPVAYDWPFCCAEARIFLTFYSRKVITQRQKS
jgi:hypothetical protein